MFAAGYVWPWLAQVAEVLFFAVAVALLLDMWLIFRPGDLLAGERFTPEKLSNGDFNTVRLRVSNRQPFAVHLEIIDELPVQFQVRESTINCRLEAGQQREIAYKLRPVERGEYHFGALNVFLCTPLRLAKRRYRFSQDKMAPVYPSFLQMRKFELHAVSDHLIELGVKKIRRIGHTLEFEHIREYVVGDDYRTVNWRATARRGDLMVNQFQDERSQQVYCLIDMGRVMKMPFERMSLLDYAINSSLVLSNIAIRKQDKAGIITFADKIAAVLPAERKNSQMQKILELLYNQRTGFQESSFEAVAALVGSKIRQRSLFVLFTNFETLQSLQRQLFYLRRIARSHLLVVIFFKNTELKSLLESTVRTTEDLYMKAIAQKFLLEKQQIVGELARFGIHAVLTTPQDLTALALNKYLELKARGLI